MSGIPKGPVPIGARLGRYVVLDVDRYDPQLGAMVRVQRDDGLVAVRSLAALRYRAKGIRKKPRAERMGRPPGEGDYGGLTLREVAERLGLSAARVGQIERRALAKMAKAAAAAGWER